MCDRVIINVTFTSKACENMKTRSTVIVYKEEDMYIAECPEIGTIDQGDIEQAIAGLTR